MSGRESEEGEMSGLCEIFLWLLLLLLIIVFFINISINTRYKIVVKDKRFGFQ